MRRRTLGSENSSRRVWGQKPGQLIFTKIKAYSITIGLIFIIILNNVY
ncbi:hypothetical protein NRP93_000284 [Clostridium botulinum]|nr:hypothetical protein [Clostridium botulinum]